MLSVSSCRRNNVTPESAWGREARLWAVITGYDRVFGNSGVTAQSSTELLQGSDSAGLGTAAPVFELPHELLLGGIRALPQRRELLPHLADRIEHLALAQRLAHLRFFPGGQRVPARMKQAFD